MVDNNKSISTADYIESHDVANKRRFLFLYAFWTLYRTVNNQSVLDTSLKSGYPATRLVF